MYSFKCKHQNLILHPGRVLFWEEEKMLILSDLHLGKTGHFRKSGIAVPQNVYKEDLQRLVSLVQFFDPYQVVIVGDLFHSEENKEMGLFKKWRNDLSSVKLHLVKGNHDILHDDWYKEADISVSSHQFAVGPFLFCHDLSDAELPLQHRQPADSKGQWTLHSEPYTFAGHIHPGISIKGLGRQSLHFPCFYFTDTHCVLPAFSRFTGTYSIGPQKGENVFAIVNNEILKVC